MSVVFQYLVGFARTWLVKKIIGIAVKARIAVDIGMIIKVYYEIERGRLWDLECRESFWINERSFQPFVALDGVSKGVHSGPERDLSLV